MNELTTETPSKALPSAWVDRLIDRMHTLYGAKFADQWRGIAPGRLKVAWAEELAGYTGDELKRGLDVCRGRQWPPTLPEFMQLCRPTIDPKMEWLEACEQMRIRLQGNGEDRWSRPEVYWAAVSIGNFDLQQLSWDVIRTRWERALEIAKSDSVPEYRAALPVYRTLTRQEAGKRIRELAVQTKAEPKTRGSLEWAYRLAEREASKEPLSPIQESWWREALMVPAEMSAGEFLKSKTEDEAA